MRKSKVLETRDGVVGRVCSGPCETWKPLEDFQRRVNGPGGRVSRCYTCTGVKNPYGPSKNPRRKKSSKPIVKASRIRQNALRNRFLVRYREHHGRDPVVADFIDPVAVHNRDLECWICGESGFVDQHRHPKQPTVDHIVPVYREESTHTWDNVRLAHQGCNSSRNLKRYYADHPCCVCS